MREHLVYNTASQVLHVQECSRVKLMNKDNTRLLNIRDGLPENSKFCNLCKKRITELNLKEKTNVLKGDYLWLN